MRTRWIETGFANDLAALPMPPAPDAALVRTAVEINGRRMAMGLLAALLRGLAAGTADTPSEPVTMVNPAEVAPPIAGTLQAWRVADGATVAEGEPIATMEAMKMEMQVRRTVRDTSR